MASTAITCNVLSDGTSKETVRFLNNWPYYKIKYTSKFLFLSKSDVVSGYFIETIQCLLFYTPFYELNSYKVIKRVLSKYKIIVIFT